jgi:hypothetical protein
VGTKVASVDRLSLRDNLLMYEYIFLTLWRQHNLLNFRKRFIQRQYRRKNGNFLINWVSRWKSIATRSYPDPGQMSRFQLCISLPLENSTMTCGGIILSQWINSGTVLPLSEFALVVRHLLALWMRQREA